MMLIKISESINQLIDLWFDQIWMLFAFRSNARIEMNRCTRWIDRTNDCNWIKRSNHLIIDSCLSIPSLKQHMMHITCHLVDNDMLKMRRNEQTNAIKQTINQTIRNRATTGWKLTSRKIVAKKGAKTAPRTRLFSTVILCKILSSKRLSNVDNIMLTRLVPRIWESRIKNQERRIKNQECGDPKPEQTAGWLVVFLNDLLWEGSEVLATTHSGVWYDPRLHNGQNCT